MATPARKLQPLVTAFGGHPPNPQLIDIANDFPGMISPENIAKVMMAAQRRHIPTASFSLNAPRPVSSAPASTISSAPAPSVSRRSFAPYTPKPANNGIVVSLVSAAASIFGGGSSPLRNTGYAPAPRMTRSYAPSLSL